MSNIKYRKHPRVFQKEHDETGSLEPSITISGLCALGIVSAVFLKGLFIGYIFRKSRE